MKSVVLKSKELQVYQYLLGRMSFSQEDKNASYNAQQGYVGEWKLFKLLQALLKNEHIALYGILLDNKGTLFQLDCLLIFYNQAIMIEVKNYKGEFEFREDQLYCMTTDKYYQNPLHQLQRSDINLRETLSKLKASMPLQSYIAFVNDEFTLFAKRNPTIILPSQINSFVKKLNQISGEISTRHKLLAEKIIASNVEESPYLRLPVYQFENLRKGVFCHSCRYRMHMKDRQLYCQHCSYQESTDSGVLRNVIEFNILFPNMKITTEKIATWCALDISSRTIRRILQTYLRQHLSVNRTYYSF